MKTILTAVGAIAGGLAVGIGSSLYEHGRYGKGLTLDDLTPASTLQKPAPAPLEGPQPVAWVDRPVFEFGVMERDATRSHTFRVTNRGDYPLQISKGTTSCKCTITEFTSRTLAPGETAEITLEWTASTKANTFRETATLFTNDPHHGLLKLTVTGRIIDTFRIEPPELLFGKLLAGDEKSVQARLVSYRDENLRITESKLDDSPASRFLDLKIDPIPTAQLADPDAKSGMLITVTTKRGLPIGPFRAGVELKTNAADQDVLKIPVEGRVSSDISIVGPGWSEDQGLLSIGRVRGADGTQCKLTVFVRGNDPGGIEFQTIKTSPDFVQVHFGAKTEIQGGRVVKLPLVVEIPPGVGPISRLGTPQGGLGEILIQTNHPQVQHLRLRLRFVVEG